MKMFPILYLNIRQITEVHHKEIRLKDIAEAGCTDPDLEARCLCMRVKKIRQDKPKRYMESIFPILESLRKLDDSLQIVNLGETDFIIDYQPPKAPAPLWQWTKTIFVCAVCFCGAAFAIMTFNNDVNVTAVFGEIYRLVMGKEAQEVTALELSYSIGLALGILVFFNHFAKWKMNSDPTPLEVEMRLYEENISKTLIQNDERKEQEIDAH